MLYSHLGPANESSLRNASPVAYMMLICSYRHPSIPIRYINQVYVTIAWALATSDAGSPVTVKDDGSVVAAVYVGGAKAMSCNERIVCNTRAPQVRDKAF